MIDPYQPSQLGDRSFENGVSLALKALGRREVDTFSGTVIRFVRAGLLFPKYEVVFDFSFMAYSSLHAGNYDDDRIYD